jgi:hypothetical protein
MHGLLSNLFSRAGCSRRSMTLTLYGLLLGALVPAVLMAGRRGLGDVSVIVVALAAISACGYLVSESAWSRAAAILDMTLALALLGVVFGGPVAGFLIALIPDAIRLARRRRAFWNSGLLANAVSYAAMVLVGAAIIGQSPARAGVGFAAWLLPAGAGMAVANYVFARLLFAVVRNREPVVALVRREFLALAPLELVVIGAAVGCYLLIGPLHAVALAVFAALVYLPQVGAELLLRAPSVAALPIDDAAAVYRAALGDELGLSRDERRSIEQVNALVRHGCVSAGSARNLHQVLIDALIVDMSYYATLSQPGWSAPAGVQVVLVARAWAQLTARCTPALNHREAMGQLLHGPLAKDAPAALAAATRIANRERALTRHVAGVPRLHRAPLPRRARQGLLPRALARMAG